MWIAKLKSLKKKCNVIYIDIANACGVSKTKVCNWFNGVTMPDPGYIDIMYDKFFGGGLLYSADRLEALFSHAYDEKHNVDGQIGIYEVNEKHHIDYVNEKPHNEMSAAVVPIILDHPEHGRINAYYDHQRELIYTQYISTYLAKVCGMTWEEDDE